MSADLSQTTSDRLTISMLIVSRCRAEGQIAAKSGLCASDCPYSEELEQAGWLDGWSRERKLQGQADV